jgi:hypothetical protein
LISMDLFFLESHPTCFHPILSKNIMQEFLSVYCKGTLVAIRAYKGLRGQSVIMCE